MVAGELNSVNLQMVEKENKLACVRNRVDMVQDRFSQHQISIEKRQLQLKSFSSQTKEQANKRFVLIGEFEEEMKELCERMSEHQLCATLKRTDLNINKMTLNDRELSQSLEMTMAEVSSMETMRGQLMKDKEDKLEAEKTLEIDVRALKNAIVSGAETYEPHANVNLPRAPERQLMDY